MEPNSQPQTPTEEPKTEQPTPQQDAPAMEHDFNKGTYPQPETSVASTAPLTPTINSSEPMKPSMSEPEVAASSPLPQDKTVVTPTTPNEATTATPVAGSSAHKTGLWIWIALAVVVLAAIGLFVYVYAMS
jgi:hypothetical protein